MYSGSAPDQRFVTAFPAAHSPPMNSIQFPPFAKRHLRDESQSSFGPPLPCKLRRSGTSLFLTLASAILMVAEFLAASAKAEPPTERPSRENASSKATKETVKEPARTSKTTPVASVQAAPAQANLGLSPQVSLASPYNYATHHYNAKRQGWIANETLLNPTNVASSSFGLLWNSTPFATAVLGGSTRIPHVFASSLYVENVTMTAGSFTGGTFNVVYSVTTNGDIYAVSAAPSGFVPAGTTLWSGRISTANNDNQDSVPRGFLSTPTIDVNRNPPTLYACAETPTGWQVYAVNITNGTLLTGWPIFLNDSTLAVPGVMVNGPAPFGPTNQEGQRGGLNLNPDGTKLYIPMGDYNDGSNGYLIVINPFTPSVVSAFSTGGPNPSGGAPNAGIWASGGPAIDDNGNIFVTTGNIAIPSPSAPPFGTPAANVWSMSLLEFGPSLPLALNGTYTPWNYMYMDVNDVDLAGGGAIVLPDVQQGNVLHTVAVGGKQGNAYLLNRDQLPGSLTSRPNNPTPLPNMDQSLLPPTGFLIYSQMYPADTTGVGPLNVFGPYSENSNQTNFAKSRTTPACFQGADGTVYIIHTGATKRGVNDQQPVTPCIARLKVNTAPSANPYLTVDAYESTQVYYSPGSPIVTSNGPNNAIAWNLDTGVGVYRGTSLVNTKPYLVAVNATSTPLQTLFRSAATTSSSSLAGSLHSGGKYNEPSSARGKVFVGTDRIQTFGISSNVLAISAGGTASGKFVADAYFSGGTTGSTTNTIDRSGVTNAALPSVYQHSRRGTSTTGFQYIFPGLNSGTAYSVHLHFCDPISTAVGQRIFNVSINGAMVLTNYDIFAQTAVSNTAFDEVFCAVADSNGKVTITFAPGTASFPMVSGIEINAMPDSIAQQKWDDWLAQNGLYNAQAAVTGPIAALAGPDDSPANDGIPNLSKYAANVNPLVVDSSRVSAPQMSIVDVGGGIRYLQYTFRELISSDSVGLSFQIETTPTLSPANWTAQPASIFSVVATGDGITQTATLRLNSPIPNGTDTLFARLRTTVAP